MSIVYVLIPVGKYNNLNEEESNSLFNVSNNKELDPRSYNNKNYYLFEADEKLALQSALKNYKFHSKNKIKELLNL